MGAWGAGIFDNDSACDWVYDFLEGGLDVVRETLDEALAEDDYLDVDVGAPVLAAAAVVARLLGDPVQQGASTADIDKWVRANPQTPPPQLVAKALAAIDRVMGDESELVELWEGDPDFTAEVTKLRARLGAP